MQSCVHVPKCNKEVDKNTDKFAIFPEKHFVTKIQWFFKQSQMKSKQGPGCDYEYCKIASYNK